jgi:hypothetical protein
MDAMRVVAKYMEPITSLKTTLAQSERDVIPLVVYFSGDEHVSELMQARDARSPFVCLQTVAE